MDDVFKTKQELIKILNERILICDGAMGTILQSLGYTISPDLLNLNPKSLNDVTEVHLNYLKAGSDIIQTNTFSANILKLKQSGHENDIEIINKNAVKAAKNALEKYSQIIKNNKKKFIAGNIGPSGKLLEPYGQTKYQEVFESFLKQAELLIKYGVDFILIEPHTLSLYSNEEQKCKRGGR